MTGDGRVCLSENVWAAYDAGGQRGWEFIDTIHEDSDDPASVARKACVQKWASGTHRILVVNAGGAHEFEVSIETSEVERAT